ncbi:MAG: histone deacetylase family protein [Alphaproteobacteria bacterium]
MPTLLYSHSACLAHDTGGHHVERPDRLRAVLGALAGAGFDGLDRREAPVADLDDVALAHPRAFVDALLAALPTDDLAALDADTVVSPGSGEAALRAAGAVCAAIDAVVAGEADNAFCAVRPPGHHAEPARPMGFCLFNSVAIGALHARTVHGLDRVAVIDFDVHHGNGTQAMFQDDRHLFYASTHQWPLYPGTGAEEETGVGNVVNAPLPAGAGGDAVKRAFDRRILPALSRFGPDLVLISAGFDAHRADPLAGLRLESDDFGWVTDALCAAADESCGGRVVSLLEGGYELAALADSAACHVERLMAAAEARHDDREEAHG